MLFDGEIIEGKLSNLEEVLNYIPRKYIRGNEWFDHVSKMYLTSNMEVDKSWDYKTDFPISMKKHLHNCFVAVYGDSRLADDSKFALCGWMLEEMLSKVPPPPGFVAVDPNIGIAT